MARRLSRRAGPEHPMLFIDGDDIPEPVRPPRPRASAALAPFAPLLRTAEAVALSDLDARGIGLSVRVAGERRPAEALLPGDALLDDGTAVVPLLIAARAPRSLRDALSARYVLITGTVRACDSGVAIEPVEATDLRALARDWSSRR